MKTLDELIEHLKYIYCGLKPRENKTASLYQYRYLSDGTLAIRKYGDWTWVSTGTSDFEEIRRILLPVISNIHNDIDFYNIYRFYDF